MDCSNIISGKKILLQNLEKGKTVQISASYPCDPTSNPLLIFPHSSFFSAISVTLSPQRVTNILYFLLKSQSSIKHGKVNEKRLLSTSENCLDC